MYTDVASCRSRTFHFPTGRAACGSSATRPAARRHSSHRLESFAGVGYPFSVGAIHAGDAVLDIGSGSGTDVLIASLLVGPGARSSAWT
jgi:hypothetical protein